MLNQLDYADMKNWYIYTLLLSLEMIRSEGVILEVQMFSN